MEEAQRTYNHEDEVMVCVSAWVMKGQNQIGMENGKTKA
jgi:hypothetical protein